MKKTTLSLLTGVIMLVTLCMFPLSASAAQTVSAEIPVEIEGGGTAIVITEVNCPLPESSSVEVRDGMTENINIKFTEQGNYSYTIQADAQNESYYSPEYYTASVDVRKDNSGWLTATVVLTKANSDYKPDKCLFMLAEESSEATETVATQPTDTDTNTDTGTNTGTGTHTDTDSGQTPKNPPTSRPQTGDDSMLDIYLLICIAAAGGLFTLSVIYSVSTDRLIGRK